MTVKKTRPVDFATRSEDETLSEHIDTIIQEAVDLATHHYAEGRPGRGAYTLQRLGVRLQRIVTRPPEGTPQ